ncbi:MAG: TetR/AcrR family transcriptional regulator [Mycobacterium sp.]
MTDTLWAPVRRRGRPPASAAAVTRERILRTAREVFAESGYEAATFQAIAAQIGLTRPAINNYFSSKSALYEEVADRVGDVLLDAVRVASQEPSLAGQIVTFTRMAMHGEDADPSIAGFLVQSVTNVGHIPVGGRRAAGVIERFVRTAVGSAIQRGETTADPDGLTDLLMGLVWGTAFQLSRGDAARAERMLVQLCGVLDHGLAH